MVSALGCHLGVLGSNLARTCLYFSFLSVLVLSLLLIFNATMVDFSHASLSVSSLNKKRIIYFYVYFKPMLFRSPHTIIITHYIPRGIYMFVSSRENTKIAILQTIRSTLTLSEVC